MCGALGPRWEVRAEKSRVSSVRMPSSRRRARATRWASTTSEVWDRRSKGEIVYFNCSEELGEPGLSASVAPHLGDNRSGRVQHSALLQCGGQEGAGGVLAAVDCYEKSRVEDHLGK